MEKFISVNFELSVRFPTLSAPIFLLVCANSLGTESQHDGCDGAFIAGLGGAAAAPALWPLSAEAQHTERCAFGVCVTQLTTRSCKGW
jgi:hypothetical protein